jgi:hypothetical protein
MRQHKGMRPQDIVILLQIVIWEDRDWQFQDLARSLYISGAEVSESLHRSSMAGLVDYHRDKVNRLSFFEFLQYGLPYVFPQSPGPMVKGMPTAHSYPALKEKIISEQVYVWPDVEGGAYGQAIEPLYPNQIKAAKENEQLYEALAMLDIYRAGRSREIKFAFNYLSKLLLHEPSGQHHEDPGSEYRTW